MSPGYQRPRTAARSSEERERPGLALRAAHPLRGISEILRLDVRFLAFEAPDDRVAVSKLRADPLPVHLLGREVRGPTTAEGVQHEIAGSRVNSEDATEEFDRKLVRASPLRRGV